jgi:diphthine synthase|tara:strand:+ start:2649 stop:3365 length:717 start_codon:yes stop_codon:yes gene_type:complete
MLYLIGLGLNEKGISLQGLESLKKCKKIYLENYTVDLPYKIDKLERLIGKKIIIADRLFVESEISEIIKEAKKQDVAILVYGSPLIATTHITLIQEAKNQKVEFQIIHNASILDAVTETGLQIYKFGKIASMPKWEKNFTPESFIEIVKENQKINAHTLILIDIGLDIKDAVKQIKISCKNKKIKLDKIIICQLMGTKDKKILYGKIEKLKDKKIKKPYCIIIPSELHFVEQNVLESF